MKDNSINDILAKAVCEEPLDAAEQARLDQWLAKEENRKKFEQYKNEDFQKEQLKVLFDVNVAQRKELDAHTIRNRTGAVWIRRAWIQWAAAAIFLLAVVSYLWVNKQAPGGSGVEAPKTATVAPQNDVAPGSTRAVLTLSDGRKIVLDTAAQGQLATQGSTVIRSQDGQLVYKPGAGKAGEMLYNTLTTSKGETYTIVLSDGSTVTLNSGSSIRYPIVFAADQRNVTITGEAYFDITHLKNQPFIVSNPSNGIDIQVLGTQFDANTYENEQAKVTLIKGSVVVSYQKPQTGKQTKLLKPGQQALVAEAGNLALADEVNLDEVLAWKNGLFYFKRADISTVMRQLERWYNIEVVYEGEKPTQLFGGELQRSFKLSQVIKALEYTGVKFRIEGRKLYVSK
jgi:transmembrane sensor